MVSPRRDASAQHRFRRRNRRRTLLGLALSLALHVVLFFALPVIPSSRHRTPGPEMEVVSLPARAVRPPPRVSVPEPVVPVPRPTPPSPETRRDTAGPVPPPSPTPHDVPPRLLNRREVKATLLDLYPGGLEAVDVGGVVTLWLYVDTAGRVIRTVVREPSRFEAFNRAAEAVAQSMRFRPARQAGNPVAVWVQQSIRFRTIDTTTAARGDETGGPGST